MIITLSIIKLIGLTLNFTWSIVALIQIGKGNSLFSKEYREGKPVPFYLDFLTQAWIIVQSIYLVCHLLDYLSTIETITLTIT